MAATFSPAADATTSRRVVEPHRTEYILAIEGLADKQIAQRLNLGVETVRPHVKDIYRKRQVSGSNQLLGRTARRRR